jgi:DNA-binding NtrC family response regulator
VSSRIAEAAHHASEALGYAKQSGHAATHCAAIVNLATVSVKTGDTKNATKYIALTEALPFRTKVTQVALLHAKAELAYCQQRWLDCETALAEAHDSFLDRTWSGLALHETRIRYLQRFGRWAESVELAAEVIATMEAMSDYLHSASCCLLKADGLLALGKVDDAATQLISVRSSFDDLPSEVMAEAARVGAKIYSARQELDHATKLFERGARIATAAGNALLRERIAEDFAFVVWKSSDHAASREQVDSRLEETPRLARLKRVQVFPNSSTDLLVSNSSRTASGPVFSNLSAAIDVASNVELFAQEAFALMLDARCTRGLALVAKGKRRPSDILAVSGWGYREARERARTAHPQGAIALGSARGRDFVLLVEPLDELEAAEKVSAIRKLLLGALALEKARQDEKDRAALWPEDPITETADGVFVSGQTLEILSIARRVAPTDLPVLLTGESGTGKEVLARAIHRASNRAARSFLAFNCTAVPREMLESQLFGHRRGAFTGAHEPFAGVIRAAAGGTLFLDEIGELSPDVQPKLLRFLETREIHPLGEPHPIPVDVRVLAATNRDLDRLVATGGFREDLFYRLNVIRFRLPPLRERREEIPPLIQYFLARFGKELRKASLRLTDETLEYLVLHPWPGNVRQLANELRRIVAVIGPDGVIHPQMLSAEIRASRRTVPVDDAPQAAMSLVVRTDQPLPAAVAFLERAMVSKALETSGGKFEDAAEALGISRKGLYLKRQRLGLDKN